MDELEHIDSKLFKKRTDLHTYMRWRAFGHL